MNDISKEEFNSRVKAIGAEVVSDAGWILPRFKDTPLWRVAVKSEGTSVSKLIVLREGLSRRETVEYLEKESKGDKRQRDDQTGAGQPRGGDHHGEANRR